LKAVADLSIDEARAALLFRALGNPARVRVVSELATRPGCVTGELVDVLPLAQSTVSEHLRVLKEAGIVRGVIEGDRCYCLDVETLDALVAFCEKLRDAAREATAAAQEQCC